MKRKIVLMGIAGILAMTAIIGGTLAGFNTQSGQGKTDITTKALGIELTGDKSAAEGGKMVADTYVPGSCADMPYFVTNNVEEGYDLYTRVILYKYWEDRDNGDLDPEKIHLYVKNADGSRVELLPEKDGGPAKINDWFIQYADEKQIILYYAKPLAAGEATGNVLDCVAVNEEVGNAYTGQKVVVEIRADAVQKAAAESSIPSEWGVYPGFDGAGNIVSIAE